MRNCSCRSAANGHECPPLHVAIHADSQSPTRTPPLGCGQFPVPIDQSIFCRLSVDAINNAVSTQQSRSLGAFTAAAAAAEQTDSLQPWWTPAPYPGMGLEVLVPLQK